MSLYKKNLPKGPSGQAFKTMGTKHVGVLIFFLTTHVLRNHRDHSYNFVLWKLRIKNQNCQFVKFRFNLKLTWLNQMRLKLLERWWGKDSEYNYIKLYLVF